MKIKALFLTAATFLLASAAPVFAELSFTGYLGGKLNYSASADTSYDADIKLQSFLQGQINLTPNMWGHLEFSIDTGDLISTELFHKTDAQFQVDEISLTFRFPGDSLTNYLSTFMGTYDPIGSDIFMQRYFGVLPIASKIAESWLGLSGSVLYPHFGIGVSDIMKSNSNPIAFGGYLYVNHEDEDYFVFNADLRFATVLRYLTFDFAGGIGMPMADTYKGTEVFIAVDKIYWHAGTTLLLGNNFTNSLFVQAGLYNAPFTKKSGKVYVSADDLYLLVEPRFMMNNVHLNLSVYSLPQDTVDQLIFVYNTLGLDLNVYSDALTIGRKRVTMGLHAALSFADKNISNVMEVPSAFTDGSWAITVTPYVSTTVYKGDLHFRMSFNVLSFASSTWYNAISADIGYRTKI